MLSNTKNIYHSISPEKVFRGINSWEEGKKTIPLICRNPLLLGRSKSTFRLRQRLLIDLTNLGLNIKKAELNYDCCEEDLKRISEIAVDNNCDSIITAGGGKVLDAGKLIADRLSIPCITIPLSAATCAGWTSLSNIYSKNGAFIKDKQLKSCPKVLIFDHNFVKQAPRRTLASGIADGIAKWYEASLSSGSSKDGLVQQSVQMARVLRDQLFIDGLIAFNDSNSDSWARVAEGCALTAGLIGGLGGSLCRTAAAHPIHNGITQLDFSKLSLHGEIVGFGIIVQLSIEEKYSENLLAHQTKIQLIEFLRKLNLPTTLDELGLETISISKIQKASKFISQNSPELNELPFPINQKVIYDAIMQNKSNVSNLTFTDINN